MALVFFKPCVPAFRLPATKLKSLPTMAALNNFATTNDHPRRKLPVLLFDVMDTIVRDPFYQDVPTFFGMSFNDLIECKHPAAWIEFEEWLINEMELARRIFKDGRPLDLEGLKNCMRRGYSYLDGVKELLQALHRNGYEIHAFTNYPIWYEMIEDKLKLSTYLSSTFCSCKNAYWPTCYSSMSSYPGPKSAGSTGLGVWLPRFAGASFIVRFNLDKGNRCTPYGEPLGLFLSTMTGKRKPEPDFYLEVLKHLDVDSAGCIFIDDRMKNVEAAINAGMAGLQFKNADLLRQDLSLLGVEVSLYGQNL